MNFGKAFGLLRSRVIYHGRPWHRRRLARFYRQLIEPGALCFDIGAHVGSRSAAMLAAGGRVVALEPQPALFRFLTRFVRSERMTPVQMAAGAKPGRMTLHVSSRHPTVASLSSEWIEEVGRSTGFRRVKWDRQVEVGVTTLDALIAEHGRPGLCKIDVEGMEAEILAGLSQPIAVISFEYLPAALGRAMACLDRLDELGAYRYNLVRGEGFRFESDDWLSSKEMRVWLPQIARDGRPGDVYARLAR
jgi:FkbM family methyltransferase